VVDDQHVERRAARFECQAELRSDSISESMVAVSTRRVASAGSEMPGVWRRDGTDPPCDAHATGGEPARGVTAVP